MSQHDFEIANQGFPSFRSDLNSGLQALASNSAGATEPSTTYAYQMWYDSTANLLKMRNTDNDAWITLAYFDQTNDEWEVRSAVIQAVDAAGVVIKTDDGTTRLTIADDGSITTQGDLTVGGDLDVSSGTIKLDGNYPVGTNNVALGDTALDDGSLTGNNNTALGRATLTANTSGGENTAVGTNALQSNTTASNNTAVGTNALQVNTTGGNNTAVGYQAGYSNTTAGTNVFIGESAGYLNTTGSANTYVGGDCGTLMTTGSSNTIIGRFSGNAGGLDIRTSNNNIVLSDGSGNPRFYVNGNGGGNLLGASGSNVLTVSSAAAVTSTRLIRFNVNGSITGAGTEVGSIQYNGSGTSYLTSSDYRLKENVVDLTGATDRLKQLPVHQFNFIHNPDMTVDGFLAHEAQAVVPEAVSGTKDEVDEDENPVYQGIDQSKLVPLLTAALKEAVERIETLEAKVQALETN